MSPDASRHGFTLLDSLIAIMILGLALPLIFEAVRSAAWRTASIERRDADWRAADNLMTESVATLNGPLGVREGSNGSIAWRIETSLVEEGQPENAGVQMENELIHVRVTIHRRDGFRSDDPVTLETLALAGASR